VADVLYDRLAATAARLLTKYGQDVVRRRVAQATYNPDVGATSPQYEDAVFKAALFDFGPGVTQFKGELVKSEDRRLLIEPAAAPGVGDLIVAGELAYTVLSVGQANPAGAPVAYVLHLRR
jgi:hypothetical protein